VNILYCRRFREFHFKAPIAVSNQTGRLQPLNDNLLSLTNRDIFVGKLTTEIIVDAFASFILSAYVVSCQTGGQQPHDKLTIN